ncbi:MAG: hypothetical protein ACRDO7_06200, partial [Nocardioidaceae bacterium]
EATPSTAHAPCSVRFRRAESVPIRVADRHSCCAGAAIAQYGPRGIAAHGRRRRRAEAQT